VPCLKYYRIPYEALLASSLHSCSKQCLWFVRSTTQQRVFWNVLPSIPGHSKNPRVLLRENEPHSKHTVLQSISEHKFFFLDFPEVRGRRSAATVLIALQ
jgi:hypothetical protein